MNKQEAIERINDLWSFTLEDGPFEVDLINKSLVIDIISQIDETQKPKVSRVAVEFYEKYKDEILSLDEWFSDFYSKEAIEDFPRMEELTEWLHGNDNETNRRRELALATLVTLGIDAVEIEIGGRMKGIKVIDIGSNPEETQFGTCELCFSYGMADNPYMVLEFPDGTQVTHNTYFWDWGDYCESRVNNVVDFSAWLSEQELSDGDVEDLKSGDKHVLIRLIDEYNWQLEETDE